MIRDPDSPAGMLWRISWLAGTAVQPQPEPEPEPEWNVREVTTWGGRVVSCRYLMETAESVLAQRAERAYLAAQHEVGRQIAAPSTLSRYWLESAGADELMLPSRYVVAGQWRRLRWRR